MPAGKRFSEIVYVKDQATFRIDIRTNFHFWYSLQVTKKYRVKTPDYARVRVHFASHD